MTRSTVELESIDYMDEVSQHDFDSGHSGMGNWHQVQVSGRNVVRGLFGLEERRMVRFGGFGLLGRRVHGRRREQ